ncbi:MAG TPA: hypothetical protein VLL54_20720 [Pyrinomonadaceae bacterium]|nr:hypothetical protein [Pyrinomonadaceae bacterium]
MVKRIIPRAKKFPLARRLTPKVVVPAAIVVIATLVTGTVVGPWRNTTPARKMRALIAAPFAPPPVPSPTNPSKEYVYAGSRLIATEEPAAPLAAPTGFVATTQSDLPVAQVSTSWTASAGAHHYQLERTTNIATSYTTVNANITSTTFTDTTVSSVTAYLYRVRAVDAVGNVSPYSNVDLATAVSFVDDTLQVGSTTIKAVHVTQLRQAVNAVRAVTTSLGPVSWAETVSAGVLIKASHISELRTGLDGARVALGLAACTYTNAATGQVIQKVHIDQLRQCVK